jgi:hypothetical protein
VIDVPLLHWLTSFTTIRFCVKLEIGTKRNGTFGVRDVKLLEVIII